MESSLPAVVLAGVSYQTLLVLAEGTRLIFAFALGACLGSLINVLVYRLPLGLGVVVPASRCPSCSTRLRWNDNIPVFGWLLLRGRCRYCRQPISPEYPIVEAIVGLLFMGIYGLWFTVPQLHALGMPTVWLGVDWLGIRPAWALNWGALAHGWPIVVVMIALVGSLVAMLLVDAKTCTIPLVLAWTPAAVAVVAYPAWGWWFGHRLDAGAAWAVRWQWAPGWSYAIASPGPDGWRWVGVGIGGVVGLGLGLVLMRLGLIKQSFGAEYEAWEAEHLASTESATPASAGADADSTTAACSQDDHSGAALCAGETAREPAASGESAACEPEAAGQGAAGDGPALPPREPLGWGRVVLIAGIVLACGVVGGIVASGMGRPAFAGVVVGLLVGPIVAAVPVRLLCQPPDASDEPDATEVWLEYPHARREVLREVLFLTPCVALGLAGGALAEHLAGPWTLDPQTLDATARVSVPLWLDALGGVLLGYLVGGGVVWGVRILGSLLFGKEAMGLGDVHMMAGVGAALGWIDPVLAFFLAAFVAIFREITSRALAGAGRRAMPFGPPLAVATLIVLLGKPWITEGINAWLHRPADQRIELP